MSTIFVTSYFKSFSTVSVQGVETVRDCFLILFHVSLSINSLLLVMVKLLPVVVDLSAKANERERWEMSSSPVEEREEEDGGLEE